MKLVSFTVEKYRSIVRAHRISTGKSTILIGPNNEGKSNILRALVAAMSALTRGALLVTARHRAISRYDHRRFYNWHHDFPVHLQTEQPDGKSVVRLEFELTNQETEEFRREIGSNLNGTLPLRISMGSDTALVEVAKQGPGSRTLTAKSQRIARFVAARIEFEHIPAIRTAESAQEIVQMMVERELEVLETEPEYQSALGKVAELQQPLLNTLAESIKETLRKFLPAVQNVQLRISTESRSRALRRDCEIVVDDGASTLLRFKGDGVQSLAALGIMRYASDRHGQARNLVIAIEEPESHLHPGAIHELKAVLDQLAERHQVVLTTHCPLFVDRAHVDHNVVVRNTRARPAKNIQQVRDILGVRASDNLRHAELVVVVEGEDDRVNITSLLRYHSPILREALDNGTIAIDTLSGGTNLAYKLSTLREALSLYHCFLDDDDCGRSAFETARVDGLIPYADCNLATCPGMTDSELEDMLDVDLYRGAIEKSYRVSLQSSKFRSNNKKWSDRLRDVFRQQGKTWNGRVEKDLKAKVSEAVAARPATALNDHKREAFDAFIKALEGRLGELSRSRAS